MKLLVCGSTSIEDSEWIFSELTNRFSHEKDLVVIQGMAIGVDQIARQWAEKFSFKIIDHPITKEDWRVYGKAAGPIRNKKMYMEERPDMVIAFWDGKSTGTLHMIKTARKGGTPVIILTKNPETIF